jgi:hypothetical protein
MALKEPENSSGDGLTRRGHPVYSTNPSVTSALPVRIKPGQSHRFNNAYMVAPGTGEVLGRGSFGFIEEIEVDSAEFVKIYLEGIRKYGELSKAGALLFEFVYTQMSGKGSKDKDQITLSYMLASQWKRDLTKRTFYRGMNELLEKEFLFRSLAADVYFVNIRFMFNGNRQVVAKAYYLKGSQMQQELPLEGGQILPAPGE